MTRVVFDVNVIVSAILFNESVPGQAFVGALEHGTILVSRALARELEDVLGRSKFDRYVSREERDEFLAAFIHGSTMTDITESIHVCRDPKDNQVLELAVSGNADCIVTGDTDLLVLRSFHGVQIMTPAQFQIASASH